LYLCKILFILQRLQNKYIQLVLIMHIGTDVCVRVVYMFALFFYQLVIIVSMLKILRIIKKLLHALNRFKVNFEFILQTI